MDGCPRQNPTKATKAITKLGRMIFKIPASNGSNGTGSKGNAYAVPERKIVDMIWVTKVIFK